MIETASKSPAKKDPVKNALDELFKEYSLIEEKKEFHKRRIAQYDGQTAKLQPKIVALARVCDEEIDPNSPLGNFLTEISAAGITEGVRAVLKANETWLSPMQVRAGLVRLGYELEGYKNIMASIHTVLGRLKENKEVSRLTKTQGGAVYRWRKPSEATSKKAD